MKSLLWLTAGVVVVITMTQIKAILGIQGPVIVSSIEDMVWAWRGFGAFIVLFGALSVSSIGFLRSIQTQ